MAPRYPLPAAPNGWFSVAGSGEVSVGDVRPVRVLGRDLVVFRGDDGCARVFDAHCPHLGAHLGFGGRVTGSGIACPFHGWCFDSAGRVADVPGLDRPPRAGLRSWEVCERNGQVCIWHHAEGAAPSFDIPRYRPDEEAWTPWRSSTYRVRVHVQDLTENIIDRSHFRAVHDMAPPDEDHFEVRFAGASMIVEQSLKVTAVSAAGFEVVTTTTTSGPGLVAVEVRQDPIEMLTYITQTPVDDELTDIGLHFSMKRLPDDAATESISALNNEVTNLQFTQDVPIWEHKVYRDRPLLTRADGPVSQYRRWFRQFYSAAPAASPASP